MPVSAPSKAIVPPAVSVTAGDAPPRRASASAFTGRRNAVGRPVTAAVHRKEGNRLFPNAPRRGALEAELQHPSGGRRHRLGVIAGFNARFQVGFHLIGRAEQVDRLLPETFWVTGTTARFRTAVCDRQRRGALLRKGFACAVIPTFALPVPSAGTASSHSSSHTIVQCPVVEMLSCKVVFPTSKFSEAGTA